MTEAALLTDHTASIIDRRRAQRRRVLIGAQIIFRNGFCSMGGHILNVSDTGAMLKPADVYVCPKKFKLKPRFEPSRECEVVWRKGEMLGVRYV